MLRRLTQARPGGRAGGARDDMADSPDHRRAMLAAQAAPVYRWIYAKVGNREQAEALTTRVFDVAAREVGTHAPDDLTSEGVRARLFQIARAVVADELRAFYGASAGVALEWLTRGVEEERERMTSDDDGVGDGDGNLDRANLAAARTHALLARLPARERELLTCRFLLGYPIERTAAQLQLSVPETMALQFVALRHASQLDGMAPVGEHEQAHPSAPERELASAPKVLEGCGCR